MHSFTIAANGIEAEILKVDVKSNQIQVLSSQLEVTFYRLDEVKSEFSELLSKDEMK